MVNLNPKLIDFESELNEWVLSPATTGKKEEAAQLMIKAFKEQSEWLDLDVKYLNNLPSCIGKLTKLKYLSLNINDLESLPSEIGKLSQLSTLILSYNKKLTHLPESLKQITTLTTICHGSTGISDKERNEILERNRSFAIQDHLLKDDVRFNEQELFLSMRPAQVQNAIDETYTKVAKNGPSWGYNGTNGAYNLLGFFDTEVISQRIERASPNKNELYFIDLGAGNFGWVNEIGSFLRRKYKESTDHHFHVIGVTGEGNPCDVKNTEGNVTTHKISGFKLENLLDSFAQLDLDLVNSVEFIVMSWTLCHLVSPLDTLDQTWRLLSPNNGFLFGNGFQFGPYGGENGLSETLARAFGRFSYITRRKDSQPDDFALFRSKQDIHSYVTENFKYDVEKPLINLPNIDNCFSQCRANVKPLSYLTQMDTDFGGGFHGCGTYVLEQLLGQGEFTLKHEEKTFRMPLFKESLNFLKMYLNAYDYRIPNQLSNY